MDEWQSKSNGYGVLQPKYIYIYYTCIKYNSAEMMSGFLLIKLNFIRFNVITSNNMEKSHKICGDIPIEQIYGI